MTDKLYCPRAIENGGGPNSPFKPPMNGEMEWRDDNTCSYCGSLSGDALMARLEAGNVKLRPTDKDYKVYIDSGKFYFQHLSPEQRKRFIELYNAGQILLDVPGHFYVTPFFCRMADSPSLDAE